MCFSATASFGVSVVLLPAGVYCVGAALTKQRAFLPLATMPLLISVQHFCEGLVWIGLEHHQGALARTAALWVLFFAVAFWLFWIPYSVLSIETRPQVRRALGWVALLGLVFGGALYGPILLDPHRRLHIKIVQHSIQYDCSGSQQTHSVPQGVWHLVYLGILCAPLLVSQIWGLKWFAATLVVSAVISHFVFWYAFESVWCFFSAILSLQLCLILRRLPKVRLSQ